jgi:hypothetical protein
MPVNKLTTVLGVRVKWNFAEAFKKYAVKKGLTPSALGREILLRFFVWRKWFHLTIFWLNEYVVLHDAFEKLNKDHVMIGGEWHDPPEPRYTDFQAIVERYRRGQRTPAN